MTLFILTKQNWSNKIKPKSVPSLFGIILKNFLYTEILLLYCLATVFATTGMITDTTSSNTSQYIFTSFILALSLSFFLFFIIQLLISFKTDPAKSSALDETESFRYVQTNEGSEPNQRRVDPRNQPGLILNPVFAQEGMRPLPKPSKEAVQWQRLEERRQQEHEERRLEQERQQRKRSKKQNKKRQNQNERQEQEQRREWIQLEESRQLQEQKQRQRIQERERRERGMRRTRSQQVRGTGPVINMPPSRYSTAALQRDVFLY